MRRLCSRLIDRSLVFVEILPVGIWILMAAALLFRLLLFLISRGPLDADECAEILMAMSVWEKPHFYVGWFGQNYMGSLEFYLLSLTAPWSGWSLMSVRLTMLAVVAGQLFLVAWIAFRSAGKNAATVSIALMCLLSPFAFDWELRARNYQLMVFLVLLSLALELKMTGNEGEAGSCRELLRWGGAGLLWGSAIWLNELSLFLMPPLVFLCFDRKPHILNRVLPAALGLAVGLLPRIVSNFRDDLSGVKYLLGTFLNVSSQDYESYGWKSLFMRSAEGLNIYEKIQAVKVGIGIPLILVSLVVSVIFVVHLLRRKKTSVPFFPLLLGFIVSIAIVLAALSRPRYMTIALPYIALCCGALFSAATSPRALSFGKTLGIMLVVFLISFFSVVSKAPGGTTDPKEYILTRFLQGEGLTRGIAGYDTAHKIMYYAKKRVIVSSLGGPTFTNRFLDAERLMEERGAEFVVYRNEGNDSRIQALERYVAENGISNFREMIAGKFLVFRGFSRPIYPGSYLPEEDKMHFERHRPDNPRKMSQEKANILW